jgi:nucleoid DNA-binding protein
VDELIQLVAQRAGISSAQATLAVAAMLAYLTARLPSPVVGRIREQLGEVQSPNQKDVGAGGVK